MERICLLLVAMVAPAICCWAVESIAMWPFTTTSPMDCLKGQGRWPNHGPLKEATEMQRQQSSQTFRLCKAGVAESPIHVWTLELREELLHWTLGVIHPPSGKPPSQTLISASALRSCRWRSGPAVKSRNASSRVWPCAFLRGHSEPWLLLLLPGKSDGK